MSLNFQTVGNPLQASTAVVSTYNIAYAPPADVRKEGINPRSYSTNHMGDEYGHGTRRYDVLCSLSLQYLWKYWREVLEGTIIKLHLM